MVIGLRAQMDSLATALDPAAPAAHSRATEWDKMTVEQWLDKEMWTTGGRALVKIAINTVLCAEASAAVAQLVLPECARSRRR